MGPSIAAFLADHGLPAWLVPGYWLLVAWSALAGAALSLHFTRKEGGRVDVAARALAWGMLGAIVGGYLIESLRMIPTAVAERSIMPMVHVGRAAWGGFLGGVIVSGWVVWRAGEPVGAFLDRNSVGAGIVFFAVRTGCFIAGCNYGRPTSSALGVRFPPGSIAAIDHAERGFIPLGRPSLPVHPTQLYEAALGLCIAVLALVLLPRARRDGRTFAAVLALYAIGRFGIEFARGDESRGFALGLSTAQWTSVAVLVSLAVLGGRRFARDLPQADGTCQ